MNHKTLPMRLLAVCIAMTTALLFNNAQAQIGHHGFGHGHGIGLLDSSWLHHAHMVHDSTDADNDSSEVDNDTTDHAGGFHHDSTWIHPGFHHDSLFVHHAHHDSIHVDNDSTEIENDSTEVDNDNDSTEVDNDNDSTQVHSNNGHHHRMAESDVAAVSMYPNPMTTSATLTYTVNIGANVTVDVMDLTGKKIATLLNETKAAGNYMLTLDSSGLATGQYLLRVAIGNNVTTQRMSVVK